MEKVGSSNLNTLLTRTKWPNKSYNSKWCSNNNSSSSKCIANNSNHHKILKWWSKPVYKACLQVKCRFKNLFLGFNKPRWILKSHKCKISNKIFQFSLLYNQFLLKWVSRNRKDSIWIKGSISSKDRICKTRVNNLKILSNSHRTNWEISSHHLFWINRAQDNNFFRVGSTRTRLQDC